MRFIKNYVLVDAGAALPRPCRTLAMLPAPREAGRSQEIVIAGASGPWDPRTFVTRWEQPRGPERCVWLGCTRHVSVRPLAGPGPCPRVLRRAPRPCRAGPDPRARSRRRDAARPVSAGWMMTRGKHSVRFCRTPLPSPSAPSSLHVAFVHPNLQLAHGAGNGVGPGTAEKIGNTHGVSWPGVTLLKLLESKHLKKCIRQEDLGNSIFILFFV